MDGEVAFVKRQRDFVKLASKTALCRQAQHRKAIPFQIEKTNTKSKPRQIQIQIKRPMTKQLLCLLQIKWKDKVKSKTNRKVNINYLFQNNCRCAWCGFSYYQRNNGRIKIPRHESLVSLCHLGLEKSSQSLLEFAAQESHSQAYHGILQLVAGFWEKIGGFYSCNDDHYLWRKDLINFRIPT